MKRRKSTFFLSHLLASFGIILVVRTGCLAQDSLKGCWVGHVGTETTYLVFRDDSHCAFNQGTNNCTVTYPVTNDSDYNIELDYTDSTHNLELFGMQRTARSKAMIFIFLGATRVRFRANRFSLARSIEHRFSSRRAKSRIDYASRETRPCRALDAFATGLSVERKLPVLVALQTDLFAV